MDTETVERIHYSLVWQIPQECPVTSLECVLNLLLFLVMPFIILDATFYQVIGAHHGGREFWTKEVLDIEEKFIRKHSGI